MKLDDKRKVIEVLLWAGERQICTLGHPDLISTIALENDGYGITISEAILAHQSAGRAHSDYGESALEAAYRLIESSPTLIREWFGKERGR